MPPELLETILTLTALGNFPAVIANLAMTCRHFHRLIYHGHDNHLWREIYLTTFDDPRPSLGAVISRRSGRDGEFDWAGEFTGRIAAARFIKSCVDNATDLSPKNSERVAEALRYIHSTISTALPVPPLTSPVFDQAPRRFVFPRPPLSPTSLNTKWVETLSQDGYPPALLMDQLAPRTRPSQYGHMGNDTVILTTLWEHTLAGKLFYKLVFLKGFIPNRATGATPGNGGGWPLEPTSIPGATGLASDERIITARRLARGRVYNLCFLLPERCWGPFLPMRPGQSEGELGDAPETPDEQGFFNITSEPDGGIRISGRSGRPLFTTTSMDGIEELYEDSDEYESEYEPDGLDFDEDDADDILHFVQGGLNRETHPPFIFPPPDKLMPDYAFLSAARLLIECNLREALRSPHLLIGQNENLLLSKTQLDDLASLDLTRIGGVPDYWQERWEAGSSQPVGRDVHSNPLTSPTPGARVDDVKGKGKEIPGASGAVAGWDWAGVSGEWKRCICWMDYHDLLLHNLGEREIQDEHFGETVRIFPMTLRVSGYSNPVLPDDVQLGNLDGPESLIWKLPIIHVEGTSRGSDLDTDISRTIEGTVRMIGDNAVRWSLTSSHADSSSPEWVTEGVQVGSIGSAAGVIGLWTGAEHTRADPLGPFWAWRIG